MGDGEPEGVEQLGSAVPSQGCEGAGLADGLHSVPSAFTQGLGVPLGVGEGEHGLPAVSTHGDGDGVGLTVGQLGLVAGSQGSRDGAGDALALGHLTPAVGMQGVGDGEGDGVGLHSVPSAFTQGRGVALALVSLAGPGEGDALHGLPAASTHGEGEAEGEHATPLVAIQGVGVVVGVGDGRAVSDADAVGLHGLPTASTHGEGEGEGEQGFPVVASMQGADGEAVAVREHLHEWGLGSGRVPSLHQQQSPATVTLCICDQRHLPPHPACKHVRCVRSTGGR